MATKDLKKFLQRIPTWPEEAQREALQSLQTIEEDFVVDAALARDLSRAEDEIRLGHGAPLEEVFERYGV